MAKPGTQEEKSGISTGTAHARSAEAPASANPKDIDKTKGFAVSQEPLQAGEHLNEHLNEHLGAHFDGQGHKYSHGRNEHAIGHGCAGGFEEDTLPENYGTRTLWLTARDPHWLFCYWDLDWREFSALRHGQARPFLHLHLASGEKLDGIEVNLDAKNWYLPAKSAGTAYYVELGMLHHNGRWEPIAKSGLAQTPPDRLAPEGLPVSFASVPFHLQFQKLLETLRMAMLEGEAVLQTLARLQGVGDEVATLRARIADLNAEQLGLLALFLGPEAFAKVQSGSEEITLLLRQKLDENLSSSASSDTLIQQRLAELIGVSESSLSSGIGASWLSAITSAATTFSSAGGSLSSESLSSFGMLREQLSSFERGFLSSWAGGALSSWGGEAGGSSWGGTSSESLIHGDSLSSWTTAAMSSWPQGGLSSWTSEFLTSWQSGAGSSWSAQPFSEDSRGFFMHVNAEVIFYGGTDPDAKVWVDGKAVALEKDGSFRYHFIFPNEEYEIPIIAESPDGKERRSVTLSFKRDTHKIGGVDDTSQSAELTPPMGAMDKK